jgi:tetratricopeptide (TPR) repeat protein
MARFARAGAAALLAVLVWAAPNEARAGDPPNVQEAAVHFQRAQDLYHVGNYGDAYAELLKAHKIDPKAKELVYNLGTVAEKLSKFEDALHWFRQYLEMDVDEHERARAEGVIRRIEGAKQQVHEDKPLERPKTMIIVRESPPRGRVDALTISTAVVAVGGFTVGAIFGVKALSDRPSSSFVTGKDGTYQDLQNRVANAHTSALVADVALIVGVVATGVTAFLFFGRTRDSQPPTAQTTVGAAPIPNGAAAFVGGTF